MSGKKKVFTVKTSDGKEVELCVVQADSAARERAHRAFNRGFREAAESGAILRQKIEDLMRDQKLWDDAKAAEVKSLELQIAHGQKKLESGGIKLSEAREVAVDMRVARWRLRELRAPFGELDNLTCEAQAEQARFESLVSDCVRYNDSGNPYFKSLDDYRARSNDDDAVESATQAAFFFHGADVDFAKKLPENVFLAKYNFVDEELRLVNKDGHLIDAKGRLIDEFGRFVDAAGNLVDENGNPMPDDKIPDQPQPFLDDDGNPLPVPGQLAETKDDAQAEISSPETGLSKD